MTNPAWVVLFTKIAGLVTNAGGLTAHPAVLSREFGIPAVVGTQDGTQRISTGDRIRVDGSSGKVEILEAAARPRNDLFTVPGGGSGGSSGSGGSGGTGAVDGSAPA
jgi:phosphoenolpyruvate synthase/pyruvate phosphate dikinase